MALDPVTAIASAADRILAAILPDKAQQQAAQAQMAQLVVNGQLQEIAGQLEIDKTEAANQSIFVAGWRPFIGWICGAALAWDFIVRPTVQWAIAVFHYTAVLQPLDLGELMPLLLGMLGLGAMRTVEKVQGINSGH